MVAVQQSRKNWISPEEYLALERSAEFKSEYLDGQLYAMSGGSPQHSAITVNVTVELGGQLKGRPCQAFSNDMKVRTSPTGLYAYPDLTVVCGEPQFHDETRDTLTNPVVIVEVLSPSTEAFDRGKKVAGYQHLESLIDYLLIAQDQPRIEHYTRQPNNRWLLTVMTEMEDSLRLPSIECDLKMSEVYDRIVFADAASEE
jgi:Uma2 family endonuclease